MLSGLLKLVGLPEEPAEVEVALGYERTHAQLTGQSQGLLGSRLPLARQQENRDGGSLEQARRHTCTRRRLGPPPPLRPLLDRLLDREPAPEQDGRGARAITIRTLPFAYPEPALWGPVPGSRGGRTGRAVAAS